MTDDSPRVKKSDFPISPEGFIKYMAPNINDQLKKQVQPILESVQEVIAASMNQHQTALLVPAKGDEDEDKGAGDVMGRWKTSS
ncbi:hypothetical protein CDV31_016558 [Fusarium ambrosium]|uniref:Uncharacterized protein n=1 Tax=Fusarium ambrosium TaxID=131363 RepID=A0A428S7H5_9HYPO|nr:hypothetical protein CDV31_016558 [Fusarium ambrosium]